MTSPSSSADSTPQHVLEQAAGVAAAQRPLGDALARRQALMSRTQASYEAALLPEDPGGLSHAERAVLACRMARICQQSGLTEHYAALLDEKGSSAELAVLATPGAQPPAEDARLMAIVAYVDLVTESPRDASPEDIQRLQQAGIAESDIVRLAGLVAFVNYQLRVAAVLAVMGEPT
ncbi:hypothetical protein IOC61_17045 [Halomonas sp. KAO]|uniref:CMD domain-containing protein n=1 Tax=Halomonas sp. KAO TaxID=2783858 RepID=UPI0018A0A938|nr:hypothetical protein [Halomonas sp. KAO]MBF7055009.1 hypothetical protein [Halomonas sp. KAO]